MAQNKFYLSFTYQCNIKEFIYLLFSLLLMFTCVGSRSKTVPSAKGSTSTESSIKFSISHIFFLMCAATVASTFTTYWSSHLLSCFTALHSYLFLMIITVFPIYYTSSLRLWGYCIFIYFLLSSFLNKDDFWLISNTMDNPTYYPELIQYHLEIKQLSIQQWDGNTYQNERQRF